MNQQGPTISVQIHSGTSLLFSCMKPVVGSDNGVKNTALVSSLRDAQDQVNQFLTELIGKSGIQEKKQGQEDEASDEGEEDDDDETDNKVNEALIQSKRKIDDDSLNFTSSNSSDTLGKRVKS